MAATTKEATKWLQKRWNEVFFPAIEAASTEEEIEALCKREVDAWRARPSIKSESSLRVPMNDTLNEVKRRLRGKDKAQKREWVLKRLAFPTSWYVEHNAPSDESLGERHEHTQFITDPDAIVERATKLLASQKWQEVAVGLAVCTGRRTTELLKTAVFEKKTAYSIIFEGQLKRRKPDEDLADDDESLDEGQGNGDEGVTELFKFEIPTLASADLVIDAHARLRAALDTTELGNRTVANRYGPAVRAAAGRCFDHLIPVRVGHDDVYTHICRSVYARIAVFYYCPPSVNDIRYMATIQGHRRYLEAKTEKEKLNYESSHHYTDYKIGDGNGNIDGRQGLRLGDPGVELLEEFKPKSQQHKDDHSVVAPPTESPADDGKKKTGFSMLKPSSKTRQRFDAVAARLGTTSHDETLIKLLDVFDGKELPAGKVEVVTPEQLVSSEIAQLVRKAMTADGAEDFPSFLAEALKAQANFRLGLVKRNTGKDFTTLSTEQLKGTKNRNATFERVKRAIEAIAAWNDQAKSPNDRYFINRTSVHKLVGGRFPIIKAYFEAHQAEIDKLNAKYNLDARYNDKPKSQAINLVVVVPGLQAVTAEVPGEEEVEGVEATEVAGGSEAEEAATPENESFAVTES